MLGFAVDTGETHRLEAVRVDARPGPRGNRAQVATRQVLTKQNLGAACQICERNLENVGSRGSRRQPTISTTPVATSYIAPAIRIVPFFSSASRIGLRRRMSATPSSTFARATASTYAAFLLERSPSDFVPGMAGLIRASS